MQDINPVTKAAMAPRMRVLVGSSLDNVKPISVNDYSVHSIDSADFTASVSVHIDGYVDPDGNPVPDDYFQHESRKSKAVTWSIQCQGKFTNAINADSLVFGISFDKPVRVPWGFTAAMAAIQMMDPTLAHDLTGPKPWAFSPLLSTMPILHRKRKSTSPFPKSAFSEEPSEPPLSTAYDTKDPLKRRAHFREQAKREEVTFEPEDVLTFDCCHGHLSFPSMGLYLPGGLSFDLLQYYNGQPFRFILAEKAPGGGSTGKSYMCIIFECIDEAGKPAKPETEPKDGTHSDEDEDEDDTDSDDSSSGVDDID